MKHVLLAALTASALSVAFIPSPSMADSGVHVGVGIGIGDGGDGGDWRRHHHRHHHCQWVPVWRHHHRMMIQQCGWGGGDGMHQGY